METQPFPVKRVTLYTAGVGLFEHETQATGVQTVSFRLEEAQLKDVLKSLVVQDASASSTVRISYPTREPRSKTLESFAVRINGPSSVEEILTGLAGAEVEIGLDPPVQGRLVGIVPEDVENENRAPRTVVHLQSSKGIFKVNLPEGVPIKLKDERLQEDLERALRFLFQSLDENRTILEAIYEGSGERPIRASYVTGAPIWKTSYRLDLSDSKLKMEGWAVVENPTDSDWEGIELNLVSGRPVSFIQDLATPRWITRHEVAIHEEQAPPPVVYAEAMPAPAPMMSAPRAKTSKRMMVMEDSEERDEFMDSDSLGGVRMDDGPAPAAEGGKAGELIKFSLKERVHLPRRKSAMLPILGGTLEGEKIIVRPKNWSEPNPLAGVRLKNTFGFRLPPGPVTVYDNGLFAGDALSDGIGEDDKRILTYAQDLTVLTEVKTQVQNFIKGYKAVKGYIYTRVTRQWETVYSAVNKDQKEKILLIEHSLDKSRKLVEPEKALETTLAEYRFQIKIAPKASGTLKVVETRLEEESIMLGQGTAYSLTSLSNSPGIKDDIKKALLGLANIKNQIDTLEKKKQETVNQYNAIGTVQERYRNNLESVGRDSLEGKSFLKKLMDSEARWETLGKEIENLDKEIEERKQAFAVETEKLSFDYYL